MLWEMTIMLSGYGHKDWEPACSYSALRTSADLADQDVAMRYTREGFGDAIPVCSYVCIKYSKLGTMYL